MACQRSKSSWSSGRASACPCAEAGRRADDSHNKTSTARGGGVGLIMRVRFSGEVKERAGQLAAIYVVIEPRRGRRKRFLPVGRAGSRAHWASVQTPSNREARRGHPL